MEKTKLALWEAVCIFFWLLLDGFWLLDWRILTYACSAVTLLAVYKIFFYLEKQPAFYLMASADLFWLAMNLLWVTHDFYKFYWCRPAAIVCFFIAGVLFLCAYLQSEEIRGVILLRLRILHSVLFQKTQK